MFNVTLKEDALKVHEKAVKRYNAAYEQIQNACGQLYDYRKSAIVTLESVENIINSIANRPQEFDKQLGEIKEHIQSFEETKAYAHEAYNEAVRSGIGIFASVVAGGAIATAAPAAAISYATAFGRATTGRAISTLSGRAAKRAAIGWLGRKTGGIATKGVIVGSGYASGKALLALAGPIGWGLTAISTTASLTSFNFKNQKVAKAAIAEAKEIMVAREVLCESKEKISQLTKMTQNLTDSLHKQIPAVDKYCDQDYLSLTEETQILLGGFVNSALALAALLNQIIE